MDTTAIGTQEGLDAYLKSRGPQAPGQASITGAAPLITAPADPVVVAEAETHFEDPETGETKDTPTRADKRIKRLWAERETEKARASRLEQELADLRAQIAVPAPAAPGAVSTPAAPTDPDALTVAAQARIRPRPDRTAIGTTYASYEDYVEDCAMWGGELAAEKRVVLDESQRAQSAEAQRGAAFARGWQEGRAAYADFDAVMAAADLPAPVVEDELKNHPTLAPHVAYWLASHPEDFQRLVRLPPAQQLLTLGKVMATVEAARQPGAVVALPPSKPQSQAPAAITPGARPAAIASRLEDASNVMDFIAKRNAQIREARPGRM